MRRMNVIRSHLHEMYGEEVNKVALSSEDDKREIRTGRQNTYVSSWTLQFKKLILEKWHGHAGHPTHPLLHRFAVIVIAITAKKLK